MKHRSAETRRCATRYNMLAMFTRKYGFPNCVEILLFAEDTCVLILLFCWNWNSRKGWIYFERFGGIFCRFDSTKEFLTGYLILFRSRDYHRPLIDRKSIMRLWGYNFCFLSFNLENMKCFLGEGKKDYVVMKFSESSCIYCKKSIKGMNRDRISAISKRNTDNLRKKKLYFDGVDPEMIYLFAYIIKERGEWRE